MASYTTSELKTDRERCDMCGNEYGKTFTITREGHTGRFDSFECAIAAMAPQCVHCSCKVLGHGVEDNGSFYCCEHCARQQVENELANPTGNLS